MDVKYTDQQIAELITERKILPDDWRTQLNRNNSLYIIGENGSRFRLITNQNEKYPSDFSVILGVINPKTGATFRIRRYNGMPKRPHNNKIEKQKIYGYHIHFATERYQERGYDGKLTQRKQIAITILKARYSVLYKMRTLNCRHRWN